jgi:hypothetical protein
MTSPSTISSWSHARTGGLRPAGAGGVTLLVLVMLALAASPAIGKAAIAPTGTERTTETRAGLGGELTARLVRLSQRRTQQIKPAGWVLTRPVCSWTRRATPASGFAPWGVVLHGRVREALLALPPPAC